MTTIYRLKAKKLPRPMDPLHVSNFYRKERMHRAQMQDRQDLILYLAKLHSLASLKKPRAFNIVKIRLTTLRDWVYDFKPALDYFFDVQQLGFNINEDNNEITTLIPKDLGLHTYAQTQDYQLEYTPPERPNDGIISKVYIHRSNSKKIIDRLMSDNRFDLVDAVKWILQHEELNFIFKPAGKLQQRDTSVWPVSAVETWPSWLRESLFGEGIDIDSAYSQYLITELQQIYSDRPNFLQKIYPDIVKSVEDKQSWRKELCEEVLGLPFTEENVSIVKKVCMSIANGSNISVGILSSGAGFSVTSEIIINAVDEVTPQRIEKIGERFQSICRQYIHAKKSICSTKIGLNPSRKNQKRVFGSYFEWERVARYAIWEAIDCHGIMVHDGIDGVPEEYLQKLPEIIQQLGIKLT